MVRYGFSRGRAAPAIAILLMLSACGGASDQGSTSAADTATGSSTTPASATAPATPSVTNHPPVISGTPALTATAGTAYSFEPTASDPDGNALTFSAQGLPAWLTLNPQTGQISGTPGNSDVGVSPDILISVSDGMASASLPAFQIQIAAAAKSTPPATASSTVPPSISGVPATTVTAGSAYSFTPTASGATGATLAFSIANKPSWASFSSVTGQLAGTPSTSQVGSYAAITISVSDGTNSSSLPSFSIQVQSAPNTPPSISGNPATSVVAGQSYSFTPTASDPDKQSLGFSISNKPTWAQFNISTGSLTGTPTSSAVGTYGNIVISVSDGIATTSLPAFSITVNPAANGTATLSWTAPTQNTDGSTLSTLSGFNVYYGLSATALNNVINVQGASQTTYVVNNLASGTYYFAVSAISSTGTESAQSSVGSKTIP